MDEENYAKGYNHADIICSKLPHLLDGIHTPENEPSDYTLGFQDRVKEYEREKAQIRNFSYQDIKATYNPDRKGKDKDRDIEMDR